MPDTASHFLTIDGNEAVALIAHKTNEVIAIYPITPASPMGEHADAWSAQGRPNIFGSVPQIIEMQSEAGAAGAIHGALQGGTLATTFTASQGLLLMLPNMYKIAGELTPTVFHIAARSVAAQALSIFADHSDVMSARGTGFAMVASNSVQEAHDMALITQAATLNSRIPVLHFFDGFRTSHEVAKIHSIEDSVIAAMIDGDAVQAHRQRALSPEHPVIRGTSQNPDVFFQARETVNPYYQQFPAILQQAMDQFADLTGRAYRLFDYEGASDAERVIIVMGCGAETVAETVSGLLAKGEKVGVLKPRLYRPFDGTALLAALPTTTRAIAVLDRTKEPGAEGDPLYKDVATAVLDAAGAGRLPFAQVPRVVGGRFGLSSKEFTPGMVCSVFDNLHSLSPRNHFTVGIVDDVTHSSLPWEERNAPAQNSKPFECLFYGLGSDGTVSANKNSIKIIGDCTDLHAQGYFVYDSKKSGAVTVSHLRFGQQPIRSAYLIGDDRARYVGCHQTIFLEKFDMLKKAAQEAVFVLNTSLSQDQVWQSLPRSAQQQMLQKNISLYIIDAYEVARQSGMGRRINTVMQTCFFAISGVLPRAEAIQQIKASVEKTYGRKGRHITRRNFEAIDNTLAALIKVPLPAEVSSSQEIQEVGAAQTDPFLKNVTAEIIAGRGDRIPVSLLPADGTYPTGTAKIEKRNIGLEIPVWDEQLCTHCGKCAFVCPHGVIRSKAFPAAAAKDAPATFKQVQIKGKDYPQGTHISYQVAPEDCTGCSLCVDICPIRDKSNASHKALNMAAIGPLKEQEKLNWDYFLGLPDMDRSEVKVNTMKGSMLLEPLFEFSGACSGCGETPYIKLASQLFGDRMVVANATGCSSIYGGNLPTTPWTKNAEGRGPAWNNSLFEDNAEFGLGIRAAYDQQRLIAEDCLRQLAHTLEPSLVEAVLNSPQSNEAEIHEQRQRVAAIRDRLNNVGEPAARQLEPVLDALCRKSIWIIGGDGWAYDIGFGGLDHVMASGRDVNILVLDTEVYSNTGGQTSKATPRGAVAKFSASGKATAKKDLARIAMTYENVYVAHVAYGAKDVHTLHTFLEAEAYDGPSLIIAYAPCIAHGVDMSNNHRQQNLAVDSGHWPLFRFDPRKAQQGQNPLKLDSKPPSVDYAEFVKSETRFSMLWNTHPQRAALLLDQARAEVHERFERYQQLAALDWDEEIQ
ncbi:MULTISPECIES: pyruvate:ferredoxin (flavodoxin) oxidoreductase [unclassified Ketobacter]|uniref:pyruvate:ferredoxin (flavodoxin) oxidoreductase n=1 Tax=unclassified Ketobacter TaxID=2639109 RepID=UPI000F133AD3|nr:MULTISPECIES: pyruvate:ferredoxin (flavodoxin) oxidoreductase [unclassified Ketobacter]RLT88041.1 MAG: pyruvate:ferredoxin (flavodoxin) oxidoreductase [Ketobacter sp. GenoA1]RLT95199.1 MAG: pyruvate:ferredoxin (flavodoxin) oxidoreductase [Ketobacter sp.]